MQPAQEAERLFPTLLERCRATAARFGSPVAIPISIYETDNDLATLRPEDGGRWTAAFHRAVMECLSEKLGAEGFPVRLVPLDAAAYLRWLAAEGMSNTPQSRAQFIGLQQSV
jgi:hypothetical protein